MEGMEKAELRREKETRNSMVAGSLAPTPEPNPKKPSGRWAPPQGEERPPILTRTLGRRSRAAGHRQQAQESLICTHQTSCKGRPCLEGADRKVRGREEGHPTGWGGKEGRVTLRGIEQDRGLSRPALKEPRGSTVCGQI